MRREPWQIGWGAALVALGSVALLANFGTLGEFGGAVWAALFWGGAAVFVALVALDRARWWALIPAGALAGLGAAVLAGGAAWGGSAFLALIGAGFLGVYALDRAHWWALIPGGALFSVALAAANPGNAAGAAMFAGLAATFALVALLPDEAGHARRWAFVPAGVLLALAVVSGPWGERVSGAVWPALLIALGALLLWRREGSEKR